MASQRDCNSDVRDEVFRAIADETFNACIIADEDGIISGSGAVAAEAERLGVLLESVAEEGARVRAGDVLVSLRGTPMRIALAEEVLMGLLAKPSGIATATYAFVMEAGRKPRIVCGAWKKMPPQLKEAVRRAIVTGGGHFRITSGPFVYLDKNYVKMLGGVKACLEAAAGMNGSARVVQLKGRYSDIAREACGAAACGAAIIFIDTGVKEDIGRVSSALRAAGLRDGVSIAFGGNIRLEDVAELKTMDVDVLDVGRAIVDAPLLDMRMEVVAAEIGTGE